MSGGNAADVSDHTASFSEMYTSTLPFVYGFVLLRLGGDKSLAEDITADTFTAALRQFQAGAGHEVDASWLRMVAKRRLVDHWRRKNVASRRLVVLGGGTSAHEDPSVAERDRVIRALGRIRENYRSVLVMQHIEGYTIAEIARIIDRSEKATESLLTRARVAFRDAWNEGGDV